MDHGGKTCNIQRKYQMLYLSNRKLSNSMRNRDLEDYLNNKKKDKCHSNRHRAMECRHGRRTSKSLIGRSGLSRGCQDRIASFLSGCTSCCGRGMTFVICVHFGVLVCGCSCVDAFATSRAFPALPERPEKFRLVLNKKCENKIA